MEKLREEQRSGLDYLEAVTALLQRCRAADPTAGLYDAGELQWWWRSARPTDELGQLFWFDEAGEPEAAVILTDWSNRVALDPIFMPNPAPELVAQVMESGLAQAAEAGYTALGLEVATDDVVLRDLLIGHGFVVDKDGLALVESWLPANKRPAVSPLHDGYRLERRSEANGRPHHMIKRGGPEVEARLQQTSLYRSDLDLSVVEEASGEVAGFGLFWFDPTTATGVVEPMRTEDEHQKRGIARHILTTGVDLLAAAGAERIKVCFLPDNSAASNLYLDVGFEPVRENINLSRQG